MKKLYLTLLMILCTIFCVSCTTSTSVGIVNGDVINDEVNTYNYNNAATANFGTSGTTLQFIVGNFRLDFVKGTSGYYVDLVNVSKSAKIYTSAKPVKIMVKTAAANTSVAETEYNSLYTTVTKQAYGYKAIGFVKTNNGSVFRVTDNYHIVNTQFVVERTVKVLAASNADYGFESEFSLASAISSPSILNYKAFVPGNIYYNKSSFSGNDTENDFSGGTYNPSSYKMFLQRESGIQLPMAMLYHATYGTVSLVHANAKISSVYGGGASTANNSVVDANFQFGSMGYRFADTNKTATLSYCYPAKECGGWQYSGKAVTVSNFRYHPVYVGFSHNYSLGIVANNQSTYVNSMVDSYNAAYSLVNSTIPNININTVYNQNIDLFSAEYREFGTGSQKAAGVPFAIDVSNARVNEGYNFCNGFVGQQIPMGYQLYAYGTENNMAAVKAQGKTMLDFWSSSLITGDTSKFAYWKWISGSNANGGKPETGDDRYLLRYVTDGAEGMIDAYAYAKKKGNTYSAWLNAALQNANVLCAKQNSDGSFYRCYQKDGNQYGTDPNQSKLGTSYYAVCVGSKQTTMIPVRYLYKCYKVTGQTKYLTAANKAIDFVYNNYYARGYYRGGAADLADLIDKEGAGCALYAFNMAYEVTGQAKYLEAAKAAAVIVMSFTYAHDFKIPNQSGNSLDVRYNAFTNGGVIGMSKISTCNDYCDNWSAYCYYDLFKIYAFSGDKTYYNYAVFLQKATKASSDYDSRVGYAYPAMMLEATQLSFFAVAIKPVYNRDGARIYQGCSSTWLPWSGVAQVEPALNMKLAFGSMDCGTYASTATSTLVTKIKAFGK